MNDQGLRDLVTKGLVQTFFKKMDWAYDNNFVLPNFLAEKTTYSDWQAFRQPSEKKSPSADRPSLRNVCFKGNDLPKIASEDSWYEESM